MTYRPRFRKQADGSRCQWFNCNCASHAMAADRHREGRDPGKPNWPWPPKPDDIRREIPGPCGGTSLNDNEAVLKKMYDVNLDVRYNIPKESFRSLIQSGRGAVVSISYAVIAPTKYDASPGFTGNHAVFVNERRASDGAFLVYDPLADHRRNGIPQAPQWWPGTLLFRAAEAYPGTSPGRIHASFTKDTV